MDWFHTHTTMQQQQQRPPLSSSSSLLRKEDEDETMTISPQAVNTLFPSRVISTRPTRESVLQRLSEALLRRSLTMIDLSQRGLVPSDARLVKMALLQNKQLAVLKLGYNNLGDVGVSILASSQSGTTTHGHLQSLASLDLGFNNVGDVGCAALCQAIAGGRSNLRTLYLAGNLIGQDGAMAIADLLRRGTNLQKLYLTGNLLGDEGVKAITEAVLDDEQVRMRNGDMMLNDEERKSSSSQLGLFAVEELYLGGTGMGPRGCEAVALLMQSSHRIRVLSLPNCEINDKSVTLLATSIRENRDNLPLESLQLSFNKITCKGVESIANSLWGINTLKELLLDNNEIADRGIQHIAAVLLPRVKQLETLNVGFNLIQAQGIVLLMKAVADFNSSLTSLSISGNAVDTSASKAIAHALTVNRLLVSLSLVHCKICAEGQRLIAAGIVSNSRTALCDFSGFSLGPVLVAIGFPAALERWTNYQVLKFVQHMWESHRRENPSSFNDDDNVGESSLDEEEKMTDPLNFLEDANTISRTAVAKDAAVVMDVAKKAYTALVASGIENVFVAGRNCHADDHTYASPIVSDGIILEAKSSCLNLQEHVNIEYSDRCSNTPSGNRSFDVSMPSKKTNSFVATPETPVVRLPDPERKKMVSDWVNDNSKRLRALADRPFNAGELWRLHQHYFTPVVNESGGESVAPSPNPSTASVALMISSVPEVARAGVGSHNGTFASDLDVDDFMDAASRPSPASTQLSSLPLLKRKVSYRFLGDASITANPFVPFPANPLQQPSASKAPERNHAMQSLPPKTKRARRNRSRISFLPKIEAKLCSLLEVSHEKALTTMRQLFYVEQALLGGKVTSLDPMAEQTHLCGELAQDAEMIIVDMMF